ncbi:DUF3240 family protein [Pseudidiomarina sediminum]|uniref:DUF3240 family protein n=1 Tax=Pseudidiomarina sediminum TaxID=431675 RepID=UPI001C96C4C4|nr:DUF3240 family protein [Pseudidiomarina sediminum]MBY6062726.1 DUF3240 family protein [Pseudidiomarina sediminum]
MATKLMKLYFSQAQKADVVDCLLQVDSISGFSIYAIEGYSRSHERYDLVEQISGARRMLTAEIICTDAAVPALQNALAQLHFSDPLRYTLVAIEANGHLN